MPDARCGLRADAVPVVDHPEAAITLTQAARATSRTVGRLLTRATDLFEPAAGRSLLALHIQLLGGRAGALGCEQGVCAGNVPAAGTVTSWPEHDEALAAA